MLGSNVPSTGPKVPSTVSLLMPMHVQGVAGELVFTRPEDEFLHATAKWSFQWDRPEAGRYSQHSRRVRVLMAVSKKAFKQALQEMAAVFQHDLSQHGL
jgi:hypothetical protein